MLFMWRLHFRKHNIKSTYYHVRSHIGGVKYNMYVYVSAAV